MIFEAKVDTNVPSVGHPGPAVPLEAMVPHWDPVVSCFQPQSQSKFDELMKRKQKKESRKLKNVLNEFNSDEIPGHKFEDLDSVLEVRVGVNKISPFSMLLYSRGGRFSPTITYLRIRLCVCVYTCNLL